VLEQAVYAGRNHTAILAAALLWSAILASPVSAQQVAETRLGTTIESLVVGTDGGAWAGLRDPERDLVGRMSVDGSIRLEFALDRLSAATLGPDGQAWFINGPDRLARVDSALRFTYLGPLFNARVPFASALVTGPDGTLWATTATNDRLARVTAGGAVTHSPFGVPYCRSAPLASDLTRAADGAVWIADTGCRRLIRVPPSGSASVVPVPFPVAVAADAAGGVWYASSGAQTGGHVDAAGTVTPLARREPATDVAVAPDGTAWFAFGRCQLLRGATLVPAPVPARQLAFDSAGGLWLASRTRLAHTPVTALGNGCDDRPPRARIAGGPALTELRRSGLEIVVREPATIRASLRYRPGAGEPTVERGAIKVVARRRGGSARFRLPRAWLFSMARVLADGRRPAVDISAEVSDRAGSVTSVERRIRVTR
jgi:streptogramin lyase